MLVWLLARELMFKRNGIPVRFRLSVLQLPLEWELTKQMLWVPFLFLKLHLFYFISINDYCYAIQVLKDFYWYIYIYAHEVYCFNACSVLSYIIRCPNRSKAITKNQGGQEGIIFLHPALLFTRRKISVGLCACYGVDKVSRVKASRRPWNKQKECKNTVNWRYI